jgi:hypothetical protein
MRADDLKRLAVPIDASDPRAPTEQFLDALELGIPSARALVQAVFADLDPNLHGTGWWANQVSSRLRVLIGDQLYVAAAAIETNLSEAKLHLLEAAPASRLGA